jgi:hypothetical protein
MKHSSEARNCGNTVCTHYRIFRHVNIYFNAHFRHEACGICIVPTQHTTHFGTRNPRVIEHTICHMTIICILANVMKRNTIKRSKLKFRLHWNKWPHNHHFKWGTPEKFIDGKHNNIKQILRTVVYIPFNTVSHLESVPVSLAQGNTLNQLDKRRWI